MKLKWLLVIVAVLLLFLVAPVQAAGEVVVTTSAIEDQIGYGETAKFVLTITNNQDKADRFVFGSTPSQLGSGTIWRYIPQVVDIGSKASEKVVFSLTPPKEIRVGVYDIDILVYSAADPSIRGIGTVRMHITDEFPQLTADIGMPTEMFPGKVPVTIIIENDGIDPQSGLSAVFESDLFGTHDLEVSSLTSKETKLVFNKEVEIPSSTEMGRYFAKVVFYKDNEYLDEVKKEIFIKGISDVKVSQEADAGFLTKKYTISLTNIGNKKLDDAWQTNFAGWQKFFISTPDLFKMDEASGQLTYFWPISLDPNESTTITYKVSYIPILALALSVLFLMYVFSWYTGKEFSLTKSAQSKKGHVEVRVHIRNNTPEIQHNVVVEDHVPTPLKLVKEFGTKAPTAIKKSTGAERVVWKFRHLGPREEVILTYGLKSRLGIVGLISLPEAVLRSKVKNKQKRFYSNKYRLKGKVSIRGHSKEQVS